MSEISYCVVTPGRTFDPIPSKSGRSDHLNEDLLTAVPVVKIKKGGQAGRLQSCDLHSSSSRSKRRKTFFSGKSPNRD